MISGISSPVCITQSQPNSKTPPYSETLTVHFEKESRSKLNFTSFDISDHMHKYKFNIQFFALCRIWYIWPNMYYYRLPTVHFYLQYIARSETLPCSAVHFFRLGRPAIRYALGSNLGKDQTVMLDWWDDEKMTLEKLLQPSWWYQKLKYFYIFNELLLRYPEPRLAEEFGLSCNFLDLELKIRITVWVWTCYEFFHTRNTSRWTSWQSCHVWNTSPWQTYINVFSSHLHIVFLVVL